MRKEKLEYKKESEEFFQGTTEKKKKSSTSGVLPTFQIPASTVVNAKNSARWIFPWHSSRMQSAWRETLLSSLNWVKRPIPINFFAH